MTKKGKVRSGKREREIDWFLSHSHSGCEVILIACFLFLFSECHLFGHFSNISPLSTVSNGPFTIYRFFSLKIIIAFFRRSVQNDAYKNFHCPYEGQCDINITSRKCCQFCRFKKCLSIGMEKSWVMTEEERLQMLKTRLEKRQKQESESSESSSSRHHQVSLLPSPSTGDRGITTALTSTTQESLSGNLSNGSSSPSNSLSSPDKAISISGNNPTPTVDVTARSQSSLKRGRYEPRLEEVQLYLTNEEVRYFSQNPHIEGVITTNSS